MGPSIGVGWPPLLARVPSHVVAMPYLDCSGLSRPHAQLVFLVDLSPPHAMQEILGWILDSSRFELASKPLFGRSLLCALVSLAIGLHLGAFFWIGLMDGQWFLSSLGISIGVLLVVAFIHLVGSFEYCFVGIRFGSFPWYTLAPVAMHVYSCPSWDIGSV